MEYGQYTLFEHGGLSHNCLEVIYACYFLNFLYFILSFRIRISYRLLREHFTLFVILTQIDMNVLTIFISLINIIYELNRTLINKSINLFVIYNFRFPPTVKKMLWFYVIFSWISSEFSDGCLCSDFWYLNLFLFEILFVQKHRPLILLFTSEFLN